MLKIKLKPRASFQPGERISVGVGWDTQEPLTLLHLETVWKTSGKGTEDVGVVSRLVIDDPQPAERRVVQIRLPQEPWSYSGRLLSIQWFLQLTAFPSESCRLMPIVISPIDGCVTGDFDAGP